MWRWCLACLVSGIVASLTTICWLEPRAARELTAQEGPGLSPVVRVSPLTARLYDPQGLTPEEAVNVAVYEAVNRSVVNINSKGVRGGLLLEIQAEGAGSGAVIDQQGHIVTNYHVVQGARTIQVTLFNGNEYEAAMVGADPLNDLAVIRIDAPPDELHPVTLGDSRRLRVGMRVFALGNPFGLERTLTTGIISSLNRSLQIHGNWTIKSIIQTDAAINPGSSGGPLLDSHGRLIGINTAIATTSGQSAGVGFAIPVSLIARVVPQLLAHGRVIRPETGIRNVFVTEKGLLIAELKPDGPAAKAGLRGPKVTRSRRGPFVIERVDKSAADLIVAIDGEKVKTIDDFLSYVEQKRPGDQVVLTIIRDGQRLDVPLILSASEPVAQN
uniref:Trypsin-like serine protease n=1 Tax=Schlesneria paludicola TaxID=360056 RepID=A0A7C4QPS2_9PLAN